MQEKKAKLKRRLYYLQKKLRNIGPVMRGSIVELKLTCSNKNCKCHVDKKYKHPALYFSVNMNKKTKLIYLGKKKLELAKQYNDNYHIMRNLINEITLINLELVKISN